MPDNIFLFYGEEDFLIKDRVEQFKQDRGGNIFAFEELDGQEASLEQITTALQINPLFGGEKTILIKNLDFSVPAVQSLVPCLRNLAGGKVIFWNGNYPKRSELLKLIEQTGQVLEFKPYAPWETDRLTAWTQNRVQLQGKKISLAAAQKLVEVCGNSLRKLASEIEKLITYAGDSPTIEEEAIDCLACAGEVNIFALSQALLEKNLKKALAVLQELIGNKEDPVAILSFLTGQYRILLFAAALPPTERQPQKIAAAMKASPYYVKKCLACLPAFTVPALQTALEEMLTVDLGLKSGENSLAMMEVLLVNLCGK